MKAETCGVQIPLHFTEYHNVNKLTFEHRAHLSRMSLNAFPLVFWLPENVHYIQIIRFMFYSDFCAHGRLNRPSDLQR